MVEVVSISYTLLALRPCHYYCRPILVLWSGFLERPSIHIGIQYFCDYCRIDYMRSVCGLFYNRLDVWGVF